MTTHGSVAAVGGPTAVGGTVILRSWMDGEGVTRPALVWSGLGRPWRSVSSGLVGGGLGQRSWWLNAQVDKEYFHPDPVVHCAEIAAQLGLCPALSPDSGFPGPDGGLTGRDDGVAMLTAADVNRWTSGSDGGVEVVATVGLGLPVPAAASLEQQQREAYRPGTINILVVVPVPLGDAALVNAVVTATEAKTQALVDAGVPGTGTSSDAICIVCPAPPEAPFLGGQDYAEVEAYGGPRSTWGSRLARAVHAAVAQGTRDWIERHPIGDPHRAWPDQPWPDQPRPDQPWPEGSLRQ
jgi:adenosylcobinamide amidohydrolase